ncbi:hypothetical protein [Longibacter sp.]|uniref:hypothetical protein n=1 Tax=Longibacter sp. TaxID=2045415 RepID=UPI003EB86ACF
MRRRTHIDFVSPGVLRRMWNAVVSTAHGCEGAVWVYGPLLAGCLCVLVVHAPDAFAQNSGAAMPETDATPEQRSVVVGIEPAYQTLSEDGNSIDQLSSEIWLSVPIGSETTVWAKSQGATTTATSLSRTTRWGDTQAGVSTGLPMGDHRLAASLRVNVPSGQPAVDSLGTSILLSQTAFGLRLPNYGRGWSVSPSLTAVFTAGDRWTLGVGALYRLVGGYTPFDGIDATYAPGNEVLLNGGFDWRFSRTAAWSLDVAYTAYGTDQFDDVDAFDPGSRWTLTSQVQMMRANRHIRVLARYTGQGRGDVPSLSGLGPPDAASTNVQALPRSFTGRLDYRVAPTEGFAFRLGGGISHYDATDIEFSGPWNLDDARTLVTARGGLNVRLGSTTTWQPGVAVTAGSFRQVSVRSALMWSP